MRGFFLRGRVNVEAFGFAEQRDAAAEVVLPDEQQEQGVALRIR
jgi:hypothetical protein